MHKSKIIEEGSIHARVSVVMFLGVWAQCCVVDLLPWFLAYGVMLIICHCVSWCVADHLPLFLGVVLC